MKKAESLRQRAADLRARADSLMGGTLANSDNHPGSLITGRSGRSVSRNRATDRAVDRLVTSAVKSTKMRQQAEALERKAWREENRLEIAREWKQRKEAWAAEEKARRDGLKLLALNERLFCGVYPTGIVFCDMRYERNGDYRRVAFIYFADLRVEISDPESQLLPMVQERIAEIKARQGEQEKISNTRTITLGYDL